jgi:hypothetical protein
MLLVIELITLANNKQVIKHLPIHKRFLIPSH